ncbi:hypothetical protein [Stenotrophomonas sp.]|uniref:hypothetical protein n=1 Tax=Stenotrophomonas sp. TaxID=69392 RepID=UPI002FC82FF9
MSNAAWSIISELLHGEAVFIALGLLATTVLVGAAWLAVISRPVLLDSAYQRLWCLPHCVPGHCYCRRTCACVTQGEVQPRD